MLSVFVEKNELLYYGSIMTKEQQVVKDKHDAIFHKMMEAGEYK